MNRALSVAAVGVCAYLAVGCGGPLTRPIPERVPDDQQKEIDAGWDKALSPVTKHDRQTWLDVMVGTRAYETGVDTLTLKSEKKWSGGTVVMEARFDRSKPADDRFTVTVLDPAGKALRKEVYARGEVEQAYRELFPADLPPKGVAADPPGVAARRAAHDARWKRIEAVLPKPKDAEPVPRPDGTK